MTAYAVVPTVASNDSWSASQHNTYIRDNFKSIMENAAAGAVPYWNASANGFAAAGLGTSIGGLLYGNGTTPVVLAKPTAAGILYNTSAGAMSWLASVAAFSGGINKIGYVDFFASDQQEAAGSYENVTNATLNLVTTATCTIIVFGKAMTYVSNTAYGAQVIAAIGTAIDAGFAPWNSNTANTTHPVLYVKTGVAAGTVTCKLKFRVTSAGATAHIDRGSFVAVAIAE